MGIIEYFKDLDWSLYTELAIRLLLSFVAGFLIGLERQKNGHPAGLKTHSLVATGSGLIMIVSMYGFKEGSGDPARLAAQVVSGIGFIGAGAIMKDGMGSIKGITTAATLWITAMIGLAFGNGMYLIAIFALVLTCIALSLIKKLENEKLRKPIFIKMIAHKDINTSDILDIFDKYGFKEHLDIKVRNFVHNNNEYVRILIRLENLKKDEDITKRIISDLRDNIEVYEFSINTDDLQ